MEGPVLGATVPLWPITRPEPGLGNYDDEDFDPEDFEPFRCYPEWVWIIFANLSTANMGFEEFGESARHSSTGVFDHVQQAV